MYVCLCNALTDADIRRAAADDSARRPAEVFAACRCRAQCGSCVKTVCAILGIGSYGADVPFVPHASPMQAAAAAA